MKFNHTAVLLAATVLAFAPALNGQSRPLPNTNPQTPNGSGSDLNTINAANATSPSLMQDKKFIHDAAEGGLAEIQFGQLASQKGSSDDVKQFGQRMVTDHTQLNEQMKPFAASKGVSLPKKPGKKEQAEYAKLNALSGDAFDKEYVSMMVTDHQKDLKEFTTEANSTADPQLKEAVQKGADVVQQHLTAIQEIAKSKGVQTGMNSGGQ